MTKKKISVPVTSEDPVLKTSATYLGKKTFVHYGAKSYLYPSSDVSSMIKSLVGYEKEFGDLYEDLRFEELRDCGCYNFDCSCSPSYILYGRRLETDVEYEYRKNKEDERKAEIEARERKQLEDLKNKYG